jgi:hypothetical protein
MEKEILARTLSRYAERFDQPEVSVQGGQVRIRLGHAREAPHGGRAFLVVEGPVGEDGTARLRVPEGAWVEGALDATEAKALSLAGERMLSALSALCHCARDPDDCDCCEPCDAEGILPEGGVCTVCAGLGYDDGASG